jgi:hypothetical protein
MSVSPDNAVGIATRYGLDGPGFESRWGDRIFRTCPERLWAHPASYKIDTGSFHEIKPPGLGVNQPPPFNADFKGRVELYFYSPSVPSYRDIG